MAIHLFLNIDELVAGFVPVVIEAVKLFQRGLNKLVVKNLVKIGNLDRMFGGKRMPYNNP